MQKFIIKRSGKKFIFKHSERKEPEPEPTFHKKHPLMVEELQKGALKRKVRVDRVHQELGKKTKCHLWEGAKTSAGYGCIKRNGKTELVHRVMFELWNRVVLTDADIVRHSCDVPLCYNPAHLLVGTHADNTADKIARNRQTRQPGERNPNARFTSEHIHMMRQLRKRGWTLQRIANIFKTSHGHVRQICVGKNWRHI